MTRRQTMLPLAAAGLVLAGLALLLRVPPVPDKPAPALAVVAEEAGWTAVDFPALRPGGALPGWEFRQGALSLVEKDGRTVLQQTPEPMTEGVAVWMKMLPRGGAVRARFFGERARRSTPRFALGMWGDLKVHLRAVPATDTVEIVLSQPVEEQGKLVERDMEKATAPWQWEREKPVWLEFRAAPKSGGYEFEGRIWPEGHPRPAAAAVRWLCPQNPGILRAAVQMAPFALRPVFCDAILTLDGP